jgi:glycosyltransferase involved in cell wall biosynthesis
MLLTILHYHFRPGGVRRVIELGAPAIVQAAGNVRRVVLAGGEAPDAGWRLQLERALFPCPVDWLIERALGYWSEQSSPPDAVRAAIRGTLGRLASAGGILWAHNPGVGRNMILTHELSTHTGRGALWLHHHDWWWDCRWERWPEMQEQGIASVAEAVAATLPDSENARHFCVNATDARRLRAWTGMDIRFLPNPVTFEPASPETALEAAAFLRRTTGAERWWLYPCRGLRRKNIAEALLVQRWLAPDTVTVTTGPASSPAEHNYCATLTEAAARHGWPLLAGVCGAADSPPVNALLAAADAAVVTSLREGFGLPLYEAAAAGRPLFARIPSSLEETLEATGLVIPNGWRELMVPAEFFDQELEIARRDAVEKRFIDFLPAELRATVPATGNRAQDWADFGALTLPAQLEVLAQPFASVRRALRARHPELESRAGPQPPPASSWTPAMWAAQFLCHPHSPPLVSRQKEWPRHAAGFLSPIVRESLRYPVMLDRVTIAPP